MISAFRRFLRTGTTQDDKLEARFLAAKIFICSIQHNLVHDQKLLVMILEAFDVSLTDIEKVMWLADKKTDISLDTARKFIEQFVSKLIESQAYMVAVSLLEHFTIHLSEESFLLQMVQSKKHKAAQKWATFIGKPMLRVLVDEYLKENLLDFAYDIIKENNMNHEYPGVCQQRKERQVNGPSASIPSNYNS